MKCCINGRNYIKLLFLSGKLFKFETQKCGQILCAHKPYFLMPGHISQFCHKLANNMYISSIATYVAQTMGTEGWLFLSS